MVSAWQPDWNAGLGQLKLERPRIGNAEVEDAGGEGRVRFACEEDIGEVPGAARATRGDDRNGDRFADASGQFAIEAGTGAVGVHRGQQDLASAPRLRLARPVQDPASYRNAPSAYIDFRIADWIAAGRGPTCIDGHDDRLRAEAAPDFVDQPRPGDGRRVDADLVRASIEDRTGVGGGADAAANGEGDEQLARGAAYRVNQRASSLMGSGYVEKHD